MEQYRQIGEVLGSVKALMVLQDDIQINQRQCCLLLAIFSLAFTTIADGIKENLKLEEKNTKWKALEQPLKELHKVFKEGEVYIRHCLDNKDWWGKAISLHHNKDCVEFHIHNLLSCFPIVVEAIETAGEISGLDPQEMRRRRVLLEKKYDKEWNDPKIFQLRFGKEYLIPREISSSFETSCREDKWLLAEAIKERKKSGSLTKNEMQLADILLKKLSISGQDSGALMPSSILHGASDYMVRRRLGSGTHYKEIQWMGEHFALRHFFGEIEPLRSEMATLLSLSHPHIMQYLFGFYNEEKKECFLVTELMNKDLCSYMKENSSPRRRIWFTIPVVVDLMLQIARGMEYLHSKKIYHGDLNPSNILLRSRNSSSQGLVFAKISGFGLKWVKKNGLRNSQSSQTDTNPVIWYAPEVLAEQQYLETPSTSKYTEKADVYSFGMLCFELLTGKVPFEDGHLQLDKTSQNIRAGGRPLFPFPSPKYLVNLTKKCWQNDPKQRPSFSSICRVLRYIKKFVVEMNSDNNQPDLQLPPVDYSELEAAFLRKMSNESNVMDSLLASSVSQIPFQMFSYKLCEKEKTSSGFKDKKTELAREVKSACGDETGSVMEDPIFTLNDTKSLYADVLSVISEIPEKQVLQMDTRSVCSEAPEKKSLLAKKPVNLYAKGKRSSVSTSRLQSAKPSPLNPCGRSFNRTKPLPLVMSPMSSNRRRRSGQVSVSDSEIS